MSLLLTQDLPVREGNVNKRTQPHQVLLRVSRSLRDEKQMNIYQCSLEILYRQPSHMGLTERSGYSPLLYGRVHAGSGRASIFLKVANDSDFWTACFALINGIRLIVARHHFQNKWSKNWSPKNCSSDKWPSHRGNMKTRLIKIHIFIPKVKG